MGEVYVSVRELKSRLSQYLQQVKAGKAVIVTNRGKPVGRIVPVAQSLEERLELMAQAGLLLWSGTRLEEMAPVAHARGGAVADLIVEGRG